MKALIYIFSLLFSFQGIAQVNLDSLGAVWEDSNRPDTVRLKAIQRVCIKGYLYSKPDSAFKLATAMYDFALEKNLKVYQVSALNIMGASCSIRGDNVRGIEYFTRSLKIAEEIQDFKSMTNSYNNIGVIYYEQRNNEKAIEYYSLSLAISEKLNRKSGIAFALGNLGNVYNSLRQYDKALAAQNRCLQLTEEIGDKEGHANALHSLSVIYLDKEEYQKTLDFSKRAHDEYEKLGDLQGIANTLTFTGLAYNRTNQKQKATECLKKALAIAQESGFVGSMREISSYLYEIYKKEGRSADALAMHELYITMRDSIASEESQRVVMQNEMQYAYDKQKALDEKEQEKTLAISAEQEQKQKVISYAITAGLILVLLFALFVFNRLRLTKKQKEIIELQKDLVEEKQKEILASIAYAKRLQEAILPPMHFVQKHLPESFIFYKPKDIVAGDFYWMEVVNNTILIAAADCTGHGVPGAMVSVVCSNALNRAVFEFGNTEPGKILDKTRELVLETFSKSDKDVKDGMDISLASINKKTGEIKWAGANSPFWYTNSGEILEVKANKQPIGKTENPTPFTTHTVAIQKGESIYMLTDGFADQFGGEKGKKFKYKPLKEMLLQNATLTEDKQMQLLDSAFEVWKSNLEQVDDVCVIGVRL